MRCPATSLACCGSSSHVGYDRLCSWPFVLSRPLGRDALASCRLQSPCSLHVHRCTERHGPSLCARRWRFLYRPSSTAPRWQRSDPCPCLLYTSDAADDLLCVDLGGRRII